MYRVTKVMNPVIVLKDGDSLVDIDKFFRFTFSNLYERSQSMYYLNSLCGYILPYAENSWPTDLTNLKVDGALFLPCKVGRIRKEIVIIKSKLRKRFLPKDYGRMYNYIESITRNRQNGFIIVRYCQNTETGIKEPFNFSLSIIKTKEIIIPQFDFTHLSEVKKRNLLLTRPTVDIFVDCSKKSITTQTANCSHRDKFAHRIANLIPSLNEQILSKDSELFILIDADHKFTNALLTTMDSEIF